MKIPKSARKAKPSAKKSVCQPDKTRNEIAEALRNIIEAVKAESDDSTLIAVLMPATTTTSQPGKMKGMGGLLSPKEILRLQIVELLYGDDLMPQSILEATHMILANGVRMGDETGEIITGLFNSLLYPDEEMKKIIEAQMEAEEKSERGKMSGEQREEETFAPAVRRRRPYRGRPSVKGRKPNDEQG